MTKDGTPVAIALLLEHKSYVDQWVGFQVLKYVERYWEQELQESGKLSPIVPVVVYHGTETWTVLTRFVRKLEELKDPKVSLNETLGRYTPDFEFHLVNLTQLSDEEVRGAVITRLFMLVLKHIFEPELGGRLDEILALAEDGETSAPRSVSEGREVAAYYRSFEQNPKRQTKRGAVQSPNAACRRRLQQRGQAQQPVLVLHRAKGWSR